MKDFRFCLVLEEIKKSLLANGKAQDFDSCIYWFESSMGYLSLIGPLAQLVRASGS